MRGSMKRYNPALPIDGGWAWVIVFAVSIVNLIIPGTGKSFGVLFPYIKEVYKTSNAQTSWIASMLGFFFFGFGTIGNVLAERFTHRIVVMAGSLLCLVAYSACFFTSKWVEVFICYIFIGIGQSMCFTPSVVILGKYFEKRRSLANGLAATGSGIGGLALPVVYSVITEQYTLRGTFLLSGAICFIVCAAAMLFRPLEKYSDWLDVPLYASIPKQGEMVIEDNKAQETRANTKLDEADGFLEPPCKRTQQLLTDVEDGVRPRLLSEPAKSLREKCYKPSNIANSLQHLSDQVDEHSRKFSLEFLESGLDGFAVSLQRLNEQKEECDENKPTAKKTVSIFKLFNFGIFKSSLFLFYFLVHMLCISGFNAVIFCLIPHAIDLGFPKPKAALLLSFFGATDLIGRPLFGLAIDRFKLRPTLAFSVAMIISGIFVTVITFMSSFIVLSVVIAFSGFLGGTGIVLMPVILADKLGVEALASSWGVTTLGLGVSAFVFPILYGGLRDVTTSWKPAFYLGSGAMLLGGTLSLIHDLYSERTKTNESK